MAVFRIEKTRDYTVMANHHLKNRALSLKAKGLLSVMLSLPEDWDYTLKGLAYISKESIDAIREGIRELESAGYIIRNRSRNEKGQLTGTDYIIYEHPQPVSDIITQACDTPPNQMSDKPIQKSPASSNPTLDEPILEEPTLDFPTQGNPTLDNPTQLNTKVIKTYPESKKTINNVSPSCPSISVGTRVMDRLIDKTVKGIETFIKSNIRYMDFWEAQPYDMKLIDEIIAVMVDVVVTPGEYVTVGGESKPRDLVSSRLLWKFDHRHIGHVIEQYKTVTTPIKKKRQYLLTMLYNATLEYDAHIENVIMSDGLNF